MVDNPEAGPGGNAVAVRSIMQAGNVVWVGGIFSEIDDANGNKIQDANALAAFDGTSGRSQAGVHIPIVTDASGNAEVYDMSLGPDGNLYFAGNFDHVDGSARNGVAAIDPATGQLVAGFPPSVGAANAVLATASAIYVGTGQLKSFQLNGAATPGWSSPTVIIIDASLRRTRDAAADPRHRDPGQHAGGRLSVRQHDRRHRDRLVKAVVEIDAQTPAIWANWSPGTLDLTGHNVPAPSASP